MSHEGWTGVINLIYDTGVPPRHRTAYGLPPCYVLHTTEDVWHRLGGPGTAGRVVSIDSGGRARGAPPIWTAPGFSQGPSGRALSRRSGIWSANANAVPGTRSASACCQSAPDYCWPVRWLVSSGVVVRWWRTGEGWSQSTRLSFGFEFFRPEILRSAGFEGPMPSLRLPGLAR